MFSVYKTFVNEIESLNLTYPMVGPNDSEQPNYELWGQMFFLPAGKTSLMKDVDGEDDQIGIFQITLSFPSGGTDTDYFSEIFQASDVLERHFKHGRTITYNGQDVFIDSSTRNGGRNNGTWYSIDISINYKATIQRS